MKKPRPRPGLLLYVEADMTAWLVHVQNEVRELSRWARIATRSCMSVVASGTSGMKAAMSTKRFGSVAKEGREIGASTPLGQGSAALQVQLNQAVGWPV